MCQVHFFFLLKRRMNVQQTHHGSTIKAHMQNRQKHSVPFAATSEKKGQTRMSRPDPLEGIFTGEMVPMLQSAPGLRVSFPTVSPSSVLVFGAYLSDGFAQTNRGVAHESGAVEGSPWRSEAGTGGCSSPPRKA